MEKTVKKLLCAFLSAALVCQLCAGCGRQSGPEDTVEQFCVALQSMDFEAMKPLFSDSDTDRIVKELVNVADSVGGLISAVLSALAEDYPAAEFVQLCFDNIRFDITSHQKLLKNVTQVSVKFSYPDLSALLRDYADRYNISAMDALLNEGIGLVNGMWGFLTGSPLTEETPQKTAPALLDWTNTQLRGGQYASINIDITFECTRVNRQWKISDAPTDSLRDMLGFGFTV